MNFMNTIPWCPECTVHTFNFNLKKKKMPTILMKFLAKKE